MRPALPITLLGCAIAGCSLLVDTSDLAPGAAAVSPAPTPLADAAVQRDSSLGAGPACPLGAIFCEDFEAGLGKWVRETQANGQLEIASDVVHGGKGAMRAVTTAESTGDFLAELERGLSPVTSGLLVFHGWMRLSGSYVSATALVKLHGVSGGYDMNLKIGADARLQIDADVPEAGAELDASEPVALDRWVCVEWQAQLGTPGHSKLILDGRTVIDADENNVPPDGYDALSIGFVGKAGAGQRISMDDIILATAPVGCP